MAEHTKILPPVVPEGHVHSEGLHDNEIALAYHLASREPKGHAAGDWRQFDRQPLAALVGTHEDLHYSLAAHEDLGEDISRWYKHMRERHLTEPVRGSLDLIRKQHHVLHPRPGHLSPYRQHTSGPQYNSQDVDTTDNLTRAFSAMHRGPEPGKEQGQQQARVNEKLKYAEDCAATARAGQGFWLNAINAYRDLGDLISQGYPLPDAWKPRG